MEANLADKALVFNLICSVVDSMVLKAVIDLDILDILHRRRSPLTLPEFLPELPSPCTNLAALRRILRYLVHLRLLSVHPAAEESYSLTPAATLLVKANHRSLAPYARYRLSEHYLPAMYALPACLTGDADKPAFQWFTGNTLWGHAAANAGDNELFNLAMASVARMTAPAIVEACSEVFETAETVVDVGGGTGTAARTIAAAFPHLKCTVFELPHVVETVAECGVVKFVGGDMFRSVPRADVVLLMWILHDWSDEKCLQILEKCKEAVLKDGGRIIIVEAVLDDEEEPELEHARMAMDMAMMAFTGGKERSKKEWEELLKQAGFINYKIKPIMSLQHVIEVYL